MPDFNILALNTWKTAKNAYNSADVPLLAGRSPPEADEGSISVPPDLSPRHHSHTFPCSSVVEQSAVNRWVASSNLAGGAKLDSNNERLSQGKILVLVVSGLTDL